MKHRVHDQVRQVGVVVPDRGLAAVERDADRGDELGRLETVGAKALVAQVDPLLHLRRGARSLCHPLVDALQPRCDERPRPLLRDTQRHDRDRADVRVGLDDGREAGAALDHPVLVLVAAQDQIDPGDLLGDLLIAGQRQVRERDDDVALPVQVRHCRARGLDRRRVAYPRLLVRVDRQAEKADADDARRGLDRNDGGPDRVGKERAARVGDVRRHHAER